MAVFLSPFPSRSDAEAIGGRCGVPNKCFRSLAGFEICHGGDGPVIDLFRRRTHSYNSKTSGKQFRARYSASFAVRTPQGRVDPAIFQPMTSKNFPRKVTTQSRPVTRHFAAQQCATLGFHYGAMFYAAVITVAFDVIHGGAQAERGKDAAAAPEEWT